MNMENGLMTWTDVLLRSFAAFGAKLMSFLPNLLGALLLLALAALLASFLRRVVSKGLGMIGFDALPAKVFGKERAERFMDDAAPSILAGKMVYWLTILLFLVTIAETLGWQVVSEKTSDLIGYLPRLFSAVLIFIIGYYIATFIRNALDATFGSMSGDTGNAISRVAYYIILVFISITALDQAGVDTTLLTANISIIIGAVEKQPEVDIRGRLQWSNDLAIFAPHCGVEQMVARRAHNPKAAGSSPAPATKEPGESRVLYFALSKSNSHGAQSRIRQHHR
jgi:hypothetical protein